MKEAPDTGLVPGNVPRVVAAQVVLIALLGILSRTWWPFAFLVVDFGLRAAARPCWSPLCFVARKALSTVDEGLGPLVAFAPKRFAACLGLACFMGATLLCLRPETLLVGQAVAGMMVGLASMEAFAGFCLGCWMHAGLVRWGVLPVPVCPDCVVHYS